MSLEGGESYTTTARDEKKVSTGEGAPSEALSFTGAGRIEEEKVRSSIETRRSARNSSGRGGTDLCRGRRLP